MKVVEGVVTWIEPWGFTPGVVTIEERVVKAGYGYEPNGRLVQQIAVEAECWFHPYTGSTPKRCEYPSERTTRCL